jgi:hypothetical protein
VSEQYCRSLERWYIGVRFYPNGECLPTAIGWLCFVRDGKGNPTLCHPTDDCSIIYNTGSSNACGGRQFLAYSYPNGAADPDPPQIAVVDEQCNPITEFTTMRVTKTSFVNSVVQLYQDSGWATENETVVVWAFGTLPPQGTFPGTFCYGSDENYAVTANGTIPPAVESTMVVISWYSEDTTSVPATVDFMVMGKLLDEPGTAVPTTNEWGLIVFSGLILSFGIWFLLRRRRRISVRV